MKFKRRRSGFTLLEMLIAGMLGIIISAFIGHAWSWYSRSMTDLKVLTLLTKELKIATEAIAQDYGPAVASRSPDDAMLEIDIDGGTFNGDADWDVPDVVIQYELVDGSLIRRDVSSGMEIHIAKNISAMTAETVEGKLQLHLVAEARQLQQDITLVLQGQ